MALAAALYLVLTVLLTWPLAARLRIMDPGDSAFFAWEIGWELHAVTTQPALLPHANIFHPLRYALGMDEPILGTTVLVAPLWALTHDAVLLFNLARLLTFVLSALSACALARELGCSRAVSLVAGAAFAFSPIRTDQIAHLSTLGTQWIPLTLLFLFRFARTGRLAHALAAAGFYVLAFYACGYHGLLGVLVLPAAGMVLLWGRWRLLPAAAAAVLAAGAGLYPLYRLHHAAMDPQGFVRTRDAALVYSASLESFLATNPWNHAYGGLTAGMRTYANNLFPGLVTLALVAGAAAAAVRARRGASRETWALVALAVAAALVALGPEVRLFGHTLAPAPLALARELVPAFARIQAASRAGIYLALALAMLAARALQRCGLRSGWVAAVGLLVLLDGMMAPLPAPGWLTVVDSRRPPPPVYAWLAQQPGDFAVVELPMLESDGLFRRPAFDESVYMVWSTHHWKRLVNGYAGLEPADYTRLKRLAWGFPAGDAVAALRGTGARYLVLHRGGYGPNQWARVERDLPRLEPPLSAVARFGDDTVYALGP